MQTLEKTEARAKTGPSVVGKSDGSQWAILAGLRFLLACIVMTAHVGMFGGNDWTDLNGILGRGCGFAAVAGFMVISGYSIAASLERSPQGFYRRRILRIYPTYLCCFAIANIPWMLGSNSIDLGSGNRFESPFGHAGMLQWALNAICLPCLITSPIPLFGQSWSLVPECFYYSVAPFIRRLSRFSLAAIAGISVVFYLLDPLFRPLLSLDVGLWPVLSIAWIWLLGFWYYSNRSTPHANAILYVALVGVAEGCGGPESSGYGGLTLSIVAGCLIFLPKIGVRRQWQPFLNWLGDLSYPIYLVHVAAFTLVQMNFAPKHCPAILSLSGALIAAIIVLYTVDYPVRAYERWRIRAAGQRLIQQQSQ